MPRDGCALWLWYFLRTSNLLYIIGIKHGCSCINIRQVPWEVLKTEASGLGFQHLPRDLANVNALIPVSVFNTSHGTWRMLMHCKTMFDCFYCIKTENICYILRYFLHYFVSPSHWCIANAISTDYARSRAGQYTSRDGNNSLAPVRACWKLRSHALTAREILPC